MNLHSAVRKLGAHFCHVCSALLLVQLGSLAAYSRALPAKLSSQSPEAAPSEQDAGRQTNSQQSPETAAKTKKVWTNEDLIALHTPADLYILEKEARQTAEAEAAAKQAARTKLVEQASLTGGLPSTVVETQNLIKMKEEQISDEQTGLERLITDLPAAPEEQKADLRKEIDRVTADIPRVRIELKGLQDQLKKLTKVQQNQAPATPANPPSQ